jgi:DNA helicase-2/ATP-dependent DNA helicase PcrA
MIHERAKARLAPSESDVGEIVEQTWISALQADPAQDRQAKKAAIKQLKRYIAHHADTFDQVAQAEASFSFGLEQHVLSGKIDLVRHAGEGHEIVDFKAGKSVPAALEQVDTQLDLYALGAASNLGLRVVRQTVHFLEDGKVYSLDWSSHRAKSAQTRLTEMLSRIARREFPPRQDYCAHCQEFRRICPYARS